MELKSQLFLPYCISHGQPKIKAVKTFLLEQKMLKFFSIVFDIGGRHVWFTTIQYVYFGKL